MAKSVHFTKMQGIGNDYIYIDTSLYEIADPEACSIAWSKPHFGIGSDGLVLIGRPTAGVEADYSMRIFNADGSEALMCGNASRCIGKYLYEKGKTDKTEIRLETKSGVKVLHLNVEGKEDGRGTVASVTVDMLEPQTEADELYINKVMRQEHPTLTAANSRFVSMGNPHFVIFVDDIAAIDVAAEGQKLEKDAAFPQRCNIEFAQVTGKDQIRTRVWERGSGITLACGTGACATAVAAVLTGRTGRMVRIDMDGGGLGIEWNQRDNHVYMTGPAEFVFEGDIRWDAE